MTKDERIEHTGGEAFGSRDIATLHAASWMSAYRGLLSDEYLDNDLEGERKKYWLKKMPTITEQGIRIGGRTGRRADWVCGCPWIKPELASTRWSIICT